MNTLLHAVRELAQEIFSMSEEYRGSVLGEKLDAFAERLFQLADRAEAESQREGQQGQDDKPISVYRAPQSLPDSALVRALQLAKRSERSPEGRAVIEWIEHRAREIAEGRHV